MIQAEYLPIVLTGLGLTASIVYYASVLQNQNKAKQRELIIQRISTITPEFYRNWRRVMSGDWKTELEWYKHISENPDDADI